LLEIAVEVVQVRRFGSHLRPTTERPDVVEEFDSAAFHGVLQQMVRKWKPGVAQLEFTQMAQYARDCAPAKTLLVEHDITFDLYEQLTAAGGDWDTRRQLAKWRAFETAAWREVDAVVTMSTKDRNRVAARKAVVLPNGVDVSRFRNPGVEPEPARLLFIGSFAHLPNVMAVQFFVDRVWPLLDGSGAALHIIAGSRSQFFLERYKDRAHVDLRRPGIQAEDFVPDVRPAYLRAAVVVAPLLASAGTNIKIMEAMAMSKAIVSTPAGINGLDVENGRDVLVVEDAEQMAAAIRALIADPERRREFERQARRTAEEKYDWAKIALDQARLYTEVGSPVQKANFNAT
jgi:glycosyltransferase involved in cell wall biosynthesis